MSVLAKENIRVETCTHLLSNLVTGVKFPIRTKPGEDYSPNSLIFGLCPPTGHNMLDDDDYDMYFLAHFSLTISC